MKIILYLRVYLYHTLSNMWHCFGWPWQEGSGHFLIHQSLMYFHCKKLFRKQLISIIWCWVIKIRTHCRDGVLELSICLSSLLPPPTSLNILYVAPFSRPNTSFWKLSTNIKFKTKRYYFVIQVGPHAHFWFSAVNKLCLEYIWIFILYIRMWQT